MEYPCLQHRMEVKRRRLGMELNKRMLSISPGETYSGRIPSMHNPGAFRRLDKEGEYSGPAFRPHMRPMTKILGAFT